jgi:segregation and condensation protein B
MAESSREPAGQEDVQGTPEELGRSYAALLGQQAWELDVPRLDEVPRQPTDSAVPAPAVPPSTPAPEPAPVAAPPPPLRILEAMLFLGGTPLTVERACEVLRGVTPGQVTQAIDGLNRSYRQQNRPYLIQSRDRGYVLVLRPRFRPVAERLYGSTREARLSPAAVDVLSLVAYRQPATKQEIDSLRGAESGALLRQLVRRGLLAVVQRGEQGPEGPHGEVAYGTTPRFLKLFGLRSLDDLPQTQDLQRL